MTTYPAVGEAFGPYTIAARLHESEWGVVFRATGSGRRGRGDFALTVLDPRFATDTPVRTWFLEVNQRLGTLHDPHLVQVRDLGVRDGLLFTASTYRDAPILARRIAERGPLPPSRAVAIAEHVARALAVVHEDGLAHGTISPDHVILDELDGAPHAVLVGLGLPDSGSPDFLAPERLAGQGPSTAADIYAVGCLLVTAITGRPPYVGTPEQVAEQHRTSAIPQWEETGPLLEHLNRVIRRALAKRPEDRYPDVRALLDEIFALERDIAARAPRSDQPKPAPLPVPAAEGAAAQPEPEPEPEVASASSEPAAIAAPIAEPEATADTPTEVEPEAVAPAEPAAPAAEEPPAPPEDVDEDDEHPSQRRRALGMAASLLALVLVAAVVTGIVLVTSGGDDDDPGTAGTPTTTTSSSPTPSGSPSGSPTDSPTPTGTRTCQEGERVVEAGQRCGEPYGLPGLRFVFASIEPECKGRRLNSDRYWEYTCQDGDATIVYSTFKNNALARESAENAYTDPPTTLPSGLLHWGPGQDEDGNWRVTLMYDGTHPYGATVTAPTPEAAEETADTLVIRAPGAFRGD